MVKEMNYYGRTPIFFAARTPRMEDIGTLLPMCSDRSERVEVKNFTPPIALEFAQREAERIDLWASNLESALHFLVEHSEGNPGSILHMIKMAQLPKYRTGRSDQGARALPRLSDGAPLVTHYFRVMK
jgi:hypothetical protein